MHEQEFSLAVLPEPPRLFRLKLKPYSIGHELHLFRRANPFLTDTDEVFNARPRGQRLAAAMQAVHVCHQGFIDNCRPSKGWRTWFTLAQWCDLDGTINQLRRHILQGHSDFDYEMPSNPDMHSRFLGAPQTLRLYQFVCDTIPRDEIALYACSKPPTAWDYPMSLANMAMEARDELAGRIEITGFKHQCMEEALKELNEREAKEKSEKCQTP